MLLNDVEIFSEDTLSSRMTQNSGKLVTGSMIVKMHNFYLTILCLHFRLMVKGPIQSISAFLQ